jgi:hypothetical protein
MVFSGKLERRAHAASVFGDELQRGDGPEIVARLYDGFTLLADLLYARVHGDVERHVGVDSMINPLSELKAEARTKAEILAYVVAESSAFVAERQYVPAQMLYRPWLAALLVDERNLPVPSSDRFATYDTASADDRRRAFSVVLERAMPEASRAPLVIYRLMQLAVKLATAQGFGRTEHAQAQRDRQLVLLQSILDCSACAGQLLPAGEKCPRCGNPFWKYELLIGD